MIDPAAIDAWMTSSEQVAAPRDWPAFMLALDPALRGTKQPPGHGVQLEDLVSSSTVPTTTKGVHDESSISG